MNKTSIAFMVLLVAAACSQEPRKECKCIPICNDHRAQWQPAPADPKGNDSSVARETCVYWDNRCGCWLLDY